MNEGTAYVNAVGDVGILCAIDTLMTKRNFAKSVNPVFGTVRPVSELASKYIQSALVNASKCSGDICAADLDYYLTRYDPYYAQMSRICKNQLMHDAVDELLEDMSDAQGQRFLKTISAVVKSARDTQGEDYYLSRDQIQAIAKKAGTSGTPNGAESEPESESESNTDQSTDGTNIGETQLPNAEQVVSPLAILQAADTPRDLMDSPQWRTYTKSLRTADSIGKKTDLFKAWCKDNGFDETSLAKESDPDRLKAYICAGINAGVGVNKAFKRWTKTAADAPSLLMSQMDMFKEVQKGGLNHPDEWKEDTKADNISRLKRIIERTNAPGAQYADTAGSRALLSMLLIDLVMKKGQLGVKNSDELAGELANLAGSDYATVMIPRLKQRGIDGTKKCLEVVENYAKSEEGLSNPYVQRWLFDFYNKNQVLTWPRTTRHKTYDDTKEEVYEEFKDAYLFEQAATKYCESTPALSKESFNYNLPDLIKQLYEAKTNGMTFKEWAANSKAGANFNQFASKVLSGRFDYADAQHITPDLDNEIRDEFEYHVRQVRGSPWAKLLEERVKAENAKKDEWNATDAVQREADKDDYTIAHTLDNDSWESREQQEVRAKFKKKTMSRRIRSLSEYVLAGDSAKASMYRKQLLDTLDAHPYFNRDPFRLDELRVNQQKDMSFSDELTEVVNRMMEYEPINDKGENIFKYYANEMIDILDDGAYLGERLPSGEDIDPRTVANRGVIVSRVNDIDMLPAMVMASHMCLMADKVGYATRTCKEAAYAFNTVLLDAASSDKYALLERMLLGTNGNDPFALLKSGALADAFIPPSVLNSVKDSNGNGLSEKVLRTFEGGECLLDRSYYDIKEDSEEIAHKLLMYKAAQMYAGLCSRLVAFNTTARLLDSVQMRNGGVRKKLGEVFTDYFKYDDPHAKDILIGYIQALEELRSTSVMSGSGLPSDLSQQFRDTEQGKDPKLIEHIDDMLDSFLAGYTRDIKPEDYSKVLNIESLPEYAVRELLPSDTIKTYLPSRFGWADDYSTGDMLAQAAEMTQKIGDSIQAEIDWIKETCGYDVWLEKDKCCADYIWFKSKSAQNTPDVWTEFKKKCKKIDAEKTNLKKWKQQFAISKNIWKNVYLMYVAPEMLPGASKVMSEVADSTLRGIVNEFSNVLKESSGSLRAYKNDAQDLIFDFFNTIQKDPREMDAKELADVFGYVYSSGKFSPDSIQFAHKEKADWDKAQADLDGFTPESIETIKDKIRMAKPFYTFYKDRLDTRSANKVLSDFYSWRGISSEDGGVNELSPRMMCNPIPEDVQKALSGQTLERRVATGYMNVNGRVVHRKMVRWVFPDYPGCEGTKDIPDAAKILCDDIYLGNTHYRVWYDPSEPGKLETDKNSMFYGYYTSKAAYSMLQNGMNITQKYYDCTFDPKDVENNKSKGYLGGLCKYEGLLKESCSPYLEITTTKGGTVSYVCDACGTRKSLGDALKGRRDILEARVEFYKNAFTIAEAQARSDVKQKLKSCFKGSGLSSAFAVVCRLRAVQKALAQAGDDRFRIIDSRLDNLNDFFDIQGKIAAIWNSPYNEQIKLDSTQKLVDEYAAQSKK